jgi:phosphate:Na+ symporter
MSPPSTATADLQQIETVLDQAYEFVLRIPSAADDPAVAARISALLHTIDHMQRLRSRLQHPPSTDLQDNRYQQAQTLATELNTLAQQGLHGQAPGDWLEQVQARAQALADLLSAVRSQLLAAPQSHDDVSRTLRITDTHRWFERSSQHVWRSSYYLQLARQPEQ